jgi:hypothetical protein
MDDIRAQLLKRSRQELARFGRWNRVHLRFVQARKRNFLATEGILIVCFLWFFLGEVKETDLVVSV